MRMATCFTGNQSHIPEGCRQIPEVGEFAYVRAFSESAISTATFVGYLIGELSQVHISSVWRIALIWNIKGAVRENHACVTALSPIAWLDAQVGHVCANAVPGSMG